MRHLITLLLITTAHLLYAQMTPKGGQTRIFAPQQAPFETAKAQAKGGSFTVNCSQNFAASCFKDYLRTFKVKKEGAILTAACYGGLVTFSTTQQDVTTTIDITINGAAFSVTAFCAFIKAEMLRTEFRKQRDLLDGMVNRKARTEAENVWFERKIERLKTEISNCENKMQLNDLAVQKYLTLIEQQQGYLSDIQSQIDELQQNQ